MKDCAQCNETQCTDRRSVGRCLWDYTTTPPSCGDVGEGATGHHTTAPLCLLPTLLAPPLRTARTAPHGTPHSSPLLHIPPTPHTARTTTAMAHHTARPTATSGSPHIADTMVPYGQGWCNTAYYAGWDGQGTESQAACNVVCVREAKCAFASWTEVTCSRYSGSSCPLHAAHGYYTYKKTGEAPSGPSSTHACYPRHLPPTHWHPQNPASVVLPVAA